MRLINELLGKVGTDKVLHFAFGGWLTALAYPFGLRVTLLAVVGVYMVSCVKEMVDDREEGNRCDWWDVMAGVMGAGSSFAWYLIIS